LCRGVVMAVFSTDDRSRRDRSGDGNQHAFEHMMEHPH
jgi:hypothetical protein